MDHICPVQNMGAVVKCENMNHIWKGYKGEICPKTLLSSGLASQFDQVPHQSLDCIKGQRLLYEDLALRGSSFL